ncbi:MAG TPA: hypothetical protein VGR28_05065 [Candidatus Thermoplasmatota archaeon]|jgi:hypothetical protein|nr:hypothetical protein [Candidatus Thermoplasmatota archaeon]
MRLEEARREVEALEQELAVERYENLAGLKAEADTGPIYAKHAALFEPATVRAALDAARGSAANEPRFLAEYLCHGSIEARVQPLSDRADTLEASLEVPLQGERVPYRALAVRVANEGHRERRRDLALVQARATEQHLNPVLRERLVMVHDLARDLGFRDYADLCGTLKGIDLAALRDQLDTLVRRTDTLYRWHMEGLLGRGASIMLAMAERHDVAHTLRAPWFDDQFPAGQSVEAFEGALAGAGLSLTAQRNILLDTEERPAKSSRAFVVAVRVPEDVRLVVRPKGGQDDYRSLFHEAGHALHFGLASPGLSVEARYLGDNSVTEGYAFVLEHILAEEAWAKPRIAPHLLERYLWQQRVLRLFMVRRYAAKLRYELELHTKGLEGAADLYKRHLDRVLVFSNPREHYLVDVDDGFYAASYLRAWAFESIVRAQLKQRFGEAWWQQRGAGDLLRSLWAQGQALTPEQVCAQLGASFGLGPLQEELIASLKTEARDYQDLPRF